MRTVHSCIIAVALCTTVLAACAQKESYVLNEYLEQTAVRHIRVEEPDCSDDAATRYPPLSDEDKAEIARQLTSALSAMTGNEVTRIIFVDASRANFGTAGGLDSSLNTGCDRCRIGRSFVSVLNDRYRSHVVSLIGESGFSKLSYRVRSIKVMCGEDAHEPGLSEMLTYVVALKAYGQGASADGMLTEILPIGNLVAYGIVPLGEKAGEPGAWYVKILD